MGKVLVSFFSATGVTKKVAEKISLAVCGDIFEIEPLYKYSDADLDWKNRESRSSVEMKDKSFRPELANKVGNIGAYDTILIGFPIWWYTAPSIINTFIDNHDLSNKRIFLFATSGGSSADGALKNLKEAYPNLNFVSARIFNGSEFPGIYSAWIA